MHAEEAQDAQIVFLDPFACVADETHAPRRDVGKSADIVVHDAIGADRQRIDGEVAPACVADPVTAERNPGMTAEGLGILAQRRDLERRAVHDQRHGAVIDARSARS